MTKGKEEIPAQEEKPSIKQTCGIIMPIAELDGCSENHWLEVRSIITEAIEDAGFSANLVSNAEDIGVIQKRIIENLYSNPIVVCDVSAKNANVMFELGLRLAFDKPTIIVKDDKTNYSFDTSPIEHLTYPRDLRFSRIVEFKRQLTDKIVQTIKKAENDPDYSTFLKHFGSFKVPKIETVEVSKDDYMIEKLNNLTEIVLAQNKTQTINDQKKSFLKSYTKTNNYEIKIILKDGDNIKTILEKLKAIIGSEKIEYKRTEDGMVVRIQTSGELYIDNIVQRLTTVGINDLIITDIKYG